jgi:hypothetical protein
MCVLHGVTATLSLAEARIDAKESGHCVCGGLICSWVMTLVDTRLEACKSKPGLAIQ